MKWLRLRFGIVLLAGIALIALVLMHAPYVNGPWYWKWPWRRLAPIRWYFPMLLAATPILAAFLLHEKDRLRILLPLVLLTLGATSLRLTSQLIQADPFGTSRISSLVQDRFVTSYYTDALAVSSEPDWLALYPQFLPLTNLHTQSKPPGAVGYFRLCIRWFGHGERSATISGIVLLLLSGLSVPAAYGVARTLGANTTAALSTANLISLSPGLLLIFPSFDPLYPVLTCAMLFTWHRSFTRDGRRWAILFGIVLTIALFVTYNLLVIGALLAIYPFFRFKDASNVLKQSVQNAIVALTVCAACYAIFWLMTGFDPIATFLSALRNQNALLAAHKDDRPWPWTILFDLTDFMLSVGWLCGALAILGILQLRGRDRWVALLCLAQIALVAITGLLQSETLRCWIFLQPLLLYPAGIELASWNRVPRIATMVLLLVIVLVIGQNMAM